MHQLSAQDYLTGYANQLKNYFRFFSLFRSIFRNYVRVIGAIMNNNYPVLAVLKDGQTVQIHGYRQALAICRGLQIVSDDLVEVQMNGRQLKFYGGVSNGDLAGIFHEGAYNTLPVMNRTVLDIGANIADSSIFFAANGAKKVIGIEPVRESYEMAVRNVVENDLEHVIEIINARCGALDSHNSTPPVYSIDYLVRTFCHDATVLKIDCEGCEYEIMSSISDSTLSQFEAIQLEYHYGYRELKSKLEKSGFQVSYTRPQRFKQFRFSQVGASMENADMVMYLGNMYAYRK